MAANATLEIRRLNTSSFDEAVQAWNEGFQGYFVDLTLSLDGYLLRLTTDGISPEYSFIAFSDGKPVGFLLNAIAEVANRKVAWNGGTGVGPEFRRRGVARALMEAAVDLYQQQKVEVATLEAIKENERAISLYRKFGFEIVDELTCLRRDGPMGSGPIYSADTTRFSVEHVAPYAVSELAFYHHMAPWQAGWMSVARTGGEALIVRDSNGVGVCYALYKKKFDAKGKLESIALYQCVVGDVEDAVQSIVGCALQSVYAPLDFPCRRVTHDLSKSNAQVIGMLLDSGFTCFVDQVQMARTFVR